jgi:hypothetical protein
MTVRELLNNDELQERLMMLIQQEIQYVKTIDPPVIDRVELFYDDSTDEFHSLERNSNEHSNNGMLYIGSIKAEQLEFANNDLNNLSLETYGEENFNELVDVEQDDILEQQKTFWYENILPEEWDEMLDDITRDVLYHEEHDVQGARYMRM